MSEIRYLNDVFTLVCWKLLNVSIALTSRAAQEGNQRAPPPPRPAPGPSQQPAPPLPPRLPPAPPGSSEGIQLKVYLTLIKDDGKPSMGDLAGPLATIPTPQVKDWLLQQWGFGSQNGFASIILYSSQCSYFRLFYKTLDAAVSARATLDKTTRVWQQGTGRQRASNSCVYQLGVMSPQQGNAAPLPQPQVEVEVEDIGIKISVRGPANGACCLAVWICMLCGIGNARAEGSVFFTPKLAPL